MPYLFSFDNGSKVFRLQQLYVIAKFCFYQSLFNACSIDLFKLCFQKCFNFFKVAKAYNLRLSLKTNIITSLNLLLNGFRKKLLRQYMYMYYVLQKSQCTSIVKQNLCGIPVILIIIVYPFVTFTDHHTICTLTFTISSEPLTLTLKLI